MKNSTANTPLWTRLAEEELLEKAHFLIELAD